MIYGLVIHPNIFKAFIFIGDKGIEIHKHKRLGQTRQLDFL